MKIYVLFLKIQIGNITMISANTVVVNEIISEITVKIQEELNNTRNNNFYIRLGSFSGVRMLSGKGPNVKVELSIIGNIETSLKSELVSSRSKSNTA